MIVKVNEIPVRHNGTRYVKGEEFEVSKKDYARLEKHVKVISEDDSEDGSEETIEGLDFKELRRVAKSLNIEGYGKMGSEQLAAAITAAREAGAGGDPA
ncbi:hypothetical protein [Paenibacillus paeoniae]|uniref:DUF7210 domain-containing protein n=1 Tax=Paenibacillus paeoniae TaxID=2292705 RepID=A0A371P075_9BACL|nr:hypothetical protein [Paenibacillus paeoniae]REK69337.1 hypothetical protein DX130_24565 [Paenibacillus paeoniae]